MSIIEKVLRLSRQAIDMLKYYHLSKKYKNPKFENLWLISERGTEAKDNGFAFFKYLRINHPEVNAWYVIDSSYENDYNRVSEYGNIIEYGSFEHKMAFFKSKYLISSHIGFLEPWSYKLYKILIDRKDKKIFILLQHGVILHDLSMYYNESNKLDLFITTTRREQEYISSPIYGFKTCKVVQTGIARYDNLNDFSLRNQILVMPTWRHNIVHPSYKSGDRSKMDKVFLNSEYYKRFNSLINNEKLNRALKELGHKLVFYPHYEIQPYLNYFENNYDTIILASKNDFDVQDLLKSSKFLVTDFSSIQFDFAYMAKPLAYYQFDSINEHYKMGYFDYKDDGFGPVFSEEAQLVDYIIERAKEDFCMEDKYLARVESEFNLRDSNNCKRIYEEIIKLEK